MVKPVMNTGLCLRLPDSVTVYDHNWVILRPICHAMVGSAGYVCHVDNLIIYTVLSILAPLGFEPGCFLCIVFVVRLLGLATWG